MNKSFLISENVPQITPCPPSGAAWQEGDYVNFFEPEKDSDYEGGYYLCYSGVAEGNYYESDDIGPFDSLYEAAEYALNSLEHAEKYAEAFRLLMHLIADGVHDIDLKDFQSRMGLEDGWDWGKVDYAQFSRIHEAIHEGLRLLQPGALSRQKGGNKQNDILSYNKQERN